jgi:hypothetical protein
VFDAPQTYRTWGSFQPYSSSCFEILRVHLVFKVSTNLTASDITRKRTVWTVIHHPKQVFKFFDKNENNVPNERLLRV